MALTRPSLPSCRAAGERHGLPPPLLVVPPLRRRSSPASPPVRLAASSSFPCALPPGRSGPASRRRRPPAPLRHAARARAARWPRPRRALAAPRRGSRPLVGLDSGRWAAGQRAPPVSACGCGIRVYLAILVRISLGFIYQQTCKMCRNSCIAPKIMKLILLVSPS